MPILLYLFFAKSKRNVALRVAVFYAALSFFTNLFIASNKQVLENYFLFTRIVTFIDLLIFTFLFYHIIKSPRLKKIILVISSITGLYLAFELTFSADAGFNSLPSGISWLIILVYSIVYLFERVKDTEALFFYSYPDFWVVASFMIYAAGTFFPFIYAKSYLSQKEFAFNFDLIHGSLYIIKNIILAFAMFARDKPEQSKYPTKKKKNNTTSINPR